MIISIHLHQVLQADLPGDPPLSASGKLAALLLTNRVLAVIQTVRRYGENRHRLIWGKYEIPLGNCGFHGGFIGIYIYTYVYKQWYIIVIKYMGVIEHGIYPQMVIFFFWEDDENPLRGALLSDKPIFETSRNRINSWFHMVQNTSLAPNIDQTSTEVIWNHGFILVHPGSSPQATCPWAAAAWVCCSVPRSSGRRRCRWPGSWPPPRRCWDPQMPRARRGWNTKPGALEGLGDGLGWFGATESEFLGWKSGVMTFFNRFDEVGRFEGNRCLRIFVWCFAGILQFLFITGDIMGYWGAACLMIFGIQVGYTFNDITDYHTMHYLWTR